MEILNIYISPEVLRMGKESAERCSYISENIMEPNLRKMNRVFERMVQGPAESPLDIESINDFICPYTFN